MKPAQNLKVAKNSVFIFLFLLLFGGCNYFRTFPLYSEVYTKNYEEIQIFDESKWIDNPYYKGSERYEWADEKKKAIGEYRSKNSNVDAKILKVMGAFKLVVGMSKIEAEIIAGKPTHKSKNELGQDVWIYKRSSDLSSWYYQWGKLRFENDLLIGIEAQHIDIRK